MRKPVLAFCLLMPFFIQAQQSLSESRYEGMNRAYSLSPIAYYEKFDDGYIVLRDGSKIEGKIEKLDQKVSVTTKDGKKFKISLYSIHHYGLNLHIPQNYSPLSYYTWNGKGTAKPERGFAILKSGETLDGKIRMTGDKFSGTDFLVETLYFTDASGKETAYTRDQLKGYGRILPWALSPYEVWQWSLAVVNGAVKSKAKPGFVMLTSGKRIDGEIQISALVDNKDLEFVDQISITHDGKKEKINVDDVLAFGLDNMTINAMTKNRSVTYPLEEMNFHEGSVVTKDGKEIKGFVAYQPKPKAYYGVYFATGLDQPITIIPNDQLQRVDQNIVTIEAFDDGSAAPVNAATDKANVNTNINGYIISLDGAISEGTVKITEDNEWWANGMDFVNKEGVATTFGGTNKPISCFVTDNKIYVQYENIFVKGETMAGPLTIYSDPFPPKVGGIGGDVLNFMSQDVSNAVGAQVSSGVLAQQLRYNKDIHATVTQNGQETDLSGLGAAYYVGQSTSNALNTGILKLTENKTVPVKGSRKDEYFIYDIRTAENTRVIYEAGSPEALNHMEVFLEGCLDFYALTNDEQKVLLDKKNYVGAIQYLNTCYTKNSKAK